jgi:hypothetical protein
MVFFRQAELENWGEHGPPEPEPCDGAFSHVASGVSSARWSTLYDLGVKG